MTARTSAIVALALLAGACRGASERDRPSSPNVAPTHMDTVQQAFAEEARTFAASYAAGVLPGKPIFFSREARPKPLDVVLADEPGVVPGTNARRLLIVADSGTQVFNTSATGWRLYRAVPMDTGVKNRGVFCAGYLRRTATTVLLQGAWCLDTRLPAGSASAPTTATP